MSWTRSLSPFFIWRTQAPPQSGLYWPSAHQRFWSLSLQILKGGIKKNIAHSFFDANFAQTCRETSRFSEFNGLQIWCFRRIGAFSALKEEGSHVLWQSQLWISFHVFVSFCYLFGCVEMTAGASLCRNETVVWETPYWKWSKNFFEVSNRLTQYLRF